MTLEALRYTPTPGGFDEVVAADGPLRPPWQVLDRRSGRSTPARSSSAIARRAGCSTRGYRSLVHDGQASESRPWRLDPLPFVIDAAEFDVLAAGAVQRMRVVEALLADCTAHDSWWPSARWPRRRCLAPRSGPLPVVRSRRPLAHALVVDVVRDATGAWRAVHGSADTPTASATRCSTAPCSPGSSARDCVRSTPPAFTITPTSFVERSPRSPRRRMRVPARWC